MKKIFFFVFIFTSTALSTSLASCASPQGTVASQATATFPPPTSTPKQTELTEFNSKTRFEGNDPQFLVGGGESPGRLVSLPQDVLAFLRNNHEGPIVNGDNFIARVSADGVCSVFTTDHLVDSGAVLSEVNDGRVVFSVDGTATVGQFRFPVPDGVACVASLAQEGSGFAPGTILVRFFRDNGKAGAQILNEEPIRPLVNAPNRIELVQLESGFQLVTTGADGQMIETQTVDTKDWGASLLPREVKEKFELAGIDLAQMQNAKYDKNGLHITLESGEVIVLTNDELIKQVHNRQVDDALLIKDDENINVVFVYKSDNFVSVDLKNMTDDEKLAAAPEIEDIIKSNISTVKNNLIIYRGVDGNAVQVYDLMTGEELTLLEAGIAELDLVDGSKLEVIAFSDKQEVMDFVASDAMWFEIKKSNINPIPLTNEMKQKIMALRDRISGIVPKNGAGLLPPYPMLEINDIKKYFLLFIYDIEENKVVIIYPSKNNEPAVVFFDDPSLKNDRSSLVPFILGGWKFNTDN